MPHYFGVGSKAYGSSELARKERRIASMHSCISSLHQQFGRGQRHLLAEGDSCGANQGLSADLDLVICVNNDNHLLDELALPVGSFRVHQSDIDNPLMLGYSCYDVFRQEFGNYDWYCFIEDDIVIGDPLFFLKLGQFYSIAGSARYLLHPNRFELSVYPEYSKTYVDGPLSEEISQLIREMRLPGCLDEIRMPFGGTEIRFAPAVNIHSGCFFLTPLHLGHLLDQPWYGQQAIGYADPLAGAANMYILALFNVFKPAYECASFLEVYHHYQKYVGLEAE